MPQFLHLARRGSNCSLVDGMTHADSQPSAWHVVSAQQTSFANIKAGATGLLRGLSEIMYEHHLACNKCLLKNKCLKKKMPALWE